MWVSHPLYVNQPGQLSLSSLLGRYMSSKAAIGCLLPQLWWRHLVNAYEGKAGMVLFSGKTVLSMSERFESMRAY